MLYYLKDEYTPQAGVYGQRSRMLHTTGNQSGSHLAIQLGHLDLIQVAVYPVQVSCNPIHRESLWGGQAVLNHNFHPGYTYENKAL